MGADGARKSHALLAVRALLYLVAVGASMLLGEVGASLLLDAVRALLLLVAVGVGASLLITNSFDISDMAKINNLLITQLVLSAEQPPNFFHFFSS